MTKKNKHEEHANHERWVISYADMVTLLFAVFVVLYAIGETKLRKLKDVAKSIAFAFHFEGEGKTQDEGLHNKGQTGGELIEGVPLISAQKGPMREFVLETLPSEFEEVTGKSLEIVVMDDTLSFTAPLSAFYNPGAVSIRPDLVQKWLGDLVTGSLTFAGEIRVVIKAPDVVIGRRSRDRTAVRSAELCLMRLSRLMQLLSMMPSVNEDELYVEFTHVTALAAAPWEDVATISFAFSNN